MLASSLSADFHAGDRPDRSTLTVDGGLTNVKASIHQRLTYSYMDAWPEYGRRRVPRPALEDVAERPRARMRAGIDLPTHSLSFPSRLIEANKKARAARKRSRREKTAALGGDRSKL